MPHDPISAPQPRIIGGLEQVRIEAPRRMRGKDYQWDHEIQIALPPSYGKTDKSYPVLWITDGPWYFELAVKAIHFDIQLHVPEMIVVAVGPPPDGLKEFVYRRSYDFFPSSNLGFNGFGGKLMDQQLALLSEQSKAAGELGLQGGGPAHFLSFLVDEVRPALSRDYRMSDDHTLFGDSGGGVFCAYALFARPSAFSRYICGSPPLYMSDGHVLHMEEQYAQEHRDLKATVFIGAGEAEMLDPKEMISAWGIVSATARLVEILRLRKYPSLKLYARIFPGEDHASVPPLNLSWGLRAVWQERIAELSRQLASNSVAASRAMDSSVADGLA